MAPHSRDAPPLLFLVRGRSADRRHSLSHQSLGARRHVSLYLRASIPPSPLLRSASSRLEPRLPCPILLPPPPQLL
ncbi:hypothetical protein LINPERHAP1_LOCUS39041, partial [Linum perenne]